MVKIRKMSEADFKSLINRYELKRIKDNGEDILALVNVENRDCELIYCRLTQSMRQEIKLTK